MLMMIRKYAFAAAIVFVCWAIWLAWLWQPERQVRLHTSQFLKKVERRNWPAAKEMMAEGYTDRWEHSKTSAIDDAKQVFSQFLFVTVENRTDACNMRDKEATTHTRVKISGNGGAVAQMVMTRVNSLQQPFTFTWRKAGSAPWRWELTHIDQPELNIDAASMSF
jgi:hypothetical protein